MSWPPWNTPRHRKAALAAVPEAPFIAKPMGTAMPRQARPNHREVDTMSTGNAGMNAAIRPVNAGAGFKMHRRFVEYQAGRDALDIWSSERAHAKLFIT
jgi:hypothetical protein